MDPQLLKTIEELDSFTRRELFRLNKDLQAAYEAHLRGESVNDLEALFQKINKSILLWGGLFAAGLVAYNVLAAKRAIDRDNDKLRIDFRPYTSNKASDKFLDNQRDRVAGFVGDTFLQRKFPGTNKNTEQRMKTVIAGAQRTVNNIIRTGVKDGTPTWEIAKQIQAYVIPQQSGLKVAPWTIARRALGKQTSYIPTGVPAGSVEYNAMRIARTETASTYQQAPYLAHKDKWYYNGIKWVLSRSHPKADICDAYAMHDEGIGIGVWRVCPKIPHPHDLCHTQTQTVAPEEMIRMFKLMNW